MNITVNSQTLARELRLLNQIIPSKPVLPILTYVKIDTCGESLRFYTTDYEVGFETTCLAQITEQGAVTLPAKRLLDLVEQMPNGDVQIALDQLVNGQQHVRVSSLAFKSRLQTLPVDDFPSVPELVASERTLPSAQFQMMIHQVHYAIAERSKYVINGALLTWTNGIIALVATDGKRLSLTTVNGQPADADSTALLPKKTLDLIPSLFADADMIEFSQSTQHLFFKSGDRLFVSRKIDGTFPNYKSIIPREHPWHVSLDRYALIAALKRVAILSDENQAVGMMFAPSQLTLTATSVSAGEAVEALPLVYDGVSLKVTMNWQHLMDFLDAAQGQTIICDLKDPLSPVILTDSGNYTNIIMTMRN